MRTAVIFTLALATMVGVYVLRPRAREQPTPTPTPTPPSVEEQPQSVPPIEPEVPASVGDPPCARGSGSAIFQWGLTLDESGPRGRWGAGAHVQRAADGDVWIVFGKGDVDVDVRCAAIGTDVYPGACTFDGDVPAVDAVDVEFRGAGAFALVYAEVRDDELSPRLVKQLRSADLSTTLPRGVWAATSCLGDRDRGAVSARSRVATSGLDRDREPAPPRIVAVRIVKGTGPVDVEKVRVRRVR